MQMKRPGRLPRPCALFGLNGLDLNIDFNVVTHGQTAGIEDFIPADPIILTVDSQTAFRSEAGFAPRVGYRTVENEGKRHLLGDTTHGQITVHDEAVVGFLDFGAGECYFRKVFDVEEIRAFEMIVAVFIIGIDACHLNGYLDR